MKKMDDAIIIMLWDSLKRLEYARNTEREVLSFETVDTIFRTNPFLELDRGRSMDVDDASEIIVDRALKLETIFAKSDELQVSFYAHLPVEVKLLLRNAGK